MLRTPLNKDHEEVRARYAHHFIFLPVFVHAKHQEVALPLLEHASTERHSKLIVLQIPVDPIRALLPAQWTDQICRKFSVQREAILGLTTPLDDGQLLMQTQEDLNQWVLCSPTFAPLLDSATPVGDIPSPKSFLIRAPRLELLLKPAYLPKTIAPASNPPAETVPCSSSTAPTSTGTASLPMASSSAVTSTSTATVDDPSRVTTTPTVSTNQSKSADESHDLDAREGGVASSDSGQRSDIAQVPQLIQKASQLIDAFADFRANASSQQTRSAGAVPAGIPITGMENFIRALPGISPDIQALGMRVAAAFAPLVNFDTASVQQQSNPPQSASAARETSMAAEATQGSTSVIADDLYIGVPEAVEDDRAKSEDTASIQRQETLVGLHDEFTRLREQRNAASASAIATNATTAELADSSQPLNTELTKAFEQLFSSKAPSDEDDDLVMVSPQASNSPRSGTRSRSRSPRSAKRTLFSSSITMLTLFSIIISCLISPTSAIATTGNFFSRDSSAVVGLEPRNSRHQHLCKCTCFQTNSTLVPIYSPVDEAKPCSTCTRQFCLDQGLDICKDAKLEHTDHDTGTGLEGDVWAKCFERDSYKDQSIITLYLLVIIGLVCFAALRGRFQGWYDDYQTMGPSAMYSAVRNAPWRR